MISGGIILTATTELIFRTMGITKRMGTGNHKVRYYADGESMETLEDILAAEDSPTSTLRVLIVGKRPVRKSVDAGHYFQGREGRGMWNRLLEWQLIRVPRGAYEDDHLLANGWGITDVVKVPGEFGEEPTPQQYRLGSQRLRRVIQEHHPSILLFVYKTALQAFLASMDIDGSGAHYGFNDKLNPDLQGVGIKSRVFLFPMNGRRDAPVEVIEAAMRELSEATSGLAR